MKTNKKKVIETKWKAKAGISPLSNIKIRVKVFIVALVYIFSVLGIFLIVEKKIYESSEKTADRMEKSVVAAASTYQRGDTTIMVQTKTIESYDATKK